ncbi:LysR family transcriptional regulator [Paenibacillus sp. WLX1005]|uniref:LysR family transcriptional regulator n=1 Tax=Paenibacillus sp. WLX1005 TaxID=3243766 RepID=UPI0039844813
MESRHLFTFLTVVETGSFTAAARKLDYAQSSVTAQIQSLEQELGTPLFDRIHKRILLTDAGRRLQPYAQEISRMHNLAREAIVSGDQIGGVLHIGAPESLAAFRLPPIIKEFRQQYPSVQIILKPGACEELHEMLRRGELDIVFLLQPHMEDYELKVDMLVEEEMALVAPPDHPLAILSHVEPHHLRYETILYTEAGCNYRLLFEKTLNRHGVFPDPSIEFWSNEAIKQCVMAGLGLAFLPLITVERELEEGKMVALNWDDTDQRVCTHISYHTKKWQSPAQSRFVQMTHQHAERWRQSVQLAHSQL